VRPAVAPKLTSRARVERAHPVWPGDVHHAIDLERCHLQPEIRQRVRPLKMQLAHVLPGVAGSAGIREAFSRVTSPYSASDRKFRRPSSCLQLQVVFTLMAREPAQDTAVAQMRIYYRPSSRNALAGVVQRLFQLRQCELTPDIGKIGPVRSSLPPDHLTGRALTLAEEESLHGRRRTAWRTVGRRMIPERLPEKSPQGESTRSA
jgi:hypothetical protein